MDIINRLSALNPLGHQNLIQAFDESCAGNADRVAFSCMGQDLSFKDLDLRSRAFARFLQEELKLSAGDRVAVQLPNILQYPIAAWGVMRAGMVLVNTNPMYTERELRHQFKDSGARVVVTLSDLLPMIEKVITDTNVEALVVVSLTGPIDTAELAISTLASLHAFDAVTSADEQTALDSSNCTMDDLAILQYTGGTTGFSKGAMLTQGNVYAAGRQSAAIWMNLFPDVERPVLIGAMPLYHIFGFNVNVVSGVLDGRLSVLIPDPRNTASIISAFKQFPITAFSGVNTLFTSLMDHPEFGDIDFSALRGVISGGTALVHEVGERWERLTGSQIYEGYGLSETAAVACCNGRGDGRQIGTVGQATVGCDVRVIGADGAVLGPGQEGELQLKGPQVMVGYWNNPEATESSITPDGWFSTGDVAIIQDDGFVRIVDRLKDMILVSGFNVYPNEVEGVLYEHPHVVECAVVGEASDKTGEAVKAFVVVADQSTDEKALLDFCRSRLAAYKLPRKIEFRADLPKSNVGKILRRELRD